MLDPHLALDAPPTFLLIFVRVVLPAAEAVVVRLITPGVEGKFSSPSR